MFDELTQQANYLIQSKMEDELKEMSKEQRDATGIDRRALYDAWYNEDVLVIHVTNRRNLDYYGGFEYVDSDHVLVVGEYVVYSGESNRVREVLDHLTSGESTEADEE